MTARRSIVLLTLAVLALSCMLWLRDCSLGGVCTTATITDSWRLVLAVAGIGGSFLLLGVWMARWTWLLVTARQRLRRFESAPTPPGLASALNKVAVGRVRCLASPHPAAFCSGSLRPQIYVTTGLVDRFQPEGLEAVLLHEEEHRRHWHPVLKALITAGADVLFFLPLVGWLAERYIDGTELAADRAAMRIVGPQAVATALWRAAEVAATPLVGFSGGNAGLRVSQLLGDPLVRQRLPLQICVLSLAGGVVAAQLAVCAAGVAAAALG